MMLLPRGRAGPGGLLARVSGPRTITGDPPGLGIFLSASSTATDAMETLPRWMFVRSGFAWRH